MSGRSGPFAILFRILFAIPFVGIGGFLLVLCLFGEVTGSRFGGLLGGLVFFCAGVYQIYLAVRAHRSPESQGAGQASATLVEMPQLALDYRSPGRTNRSAREVYGPVLDAAPLPKVKTTPGQALPVALGMRSVKSMIGMLVFATVWSLFCVPPFVALLANRSWGGAAFVSLFVAVGLGILISLARRFVSRLKLPRVEVAEEPIFLGDELRVHVEQRGPARITRLRVDFVCRERASFTVGTDRRTEEHDAFHAELLDDPGKTLSRGERWPHDLRVTLPTAAPHSFSSANNSVSWLLHVRAEIAGWPDYDEHFELRALPRIPS